MPGRTASPTAIEDVRDEPPGDRHALDLGRCS